MRRLRALCLHQWKLTDFAFASLSLKCWVPAKVQYSKDAHTAAKEFSVEARKCGGKEETLQVILQYIFKPPVLEVIFQMDTN